jgi:putative effector of murein hydrolase
VFVILTGIVGAMTVTPLLNALRVTDQRIRGFAVRVAAHGIGTARAFQVGAAGHDLGTTGWGGVPRTSRPATRLA